MMAPSDVHLLETPPVRFDVDECGRKHDRDAGRRDEHVAERRERIGRAAGGDRAHVPDHGTLRVEVGRDDQQQAALGIFAGDRCKHRLVDVARYQGAQSPVAEQARSENQVEEIRGSKKAFGVTAGIDVLQNRVIADPRNAKGAMSAPVLTPETMAKSGRFPESVQPLRIPAP